MTVYLCMLLLLVAVLQQVDGAAPTKKKRIKPVAASVAEELLVGSPVPQGDKLSRWVEEQGGFVNVFVREVPGRGRITVARQNIKKGGILAAIPRELCYVAQGPLAPAYLCSELKDPASKLKPFSELLPPRASVFSYYNIPESYLPLIQNEAIESAIRSMQGGLRQMWDLDSNVFKREIGPDMTFEDLQHAMILLETRAFSFAEPDGELLVPLVDMANHVNGCPHMLAPPHNQPCPPGSQAQECVVWQAGADLDAGSEVCHSYTEPMLQDQALLQYGFLQEGAVAQQLSGIDRHDFNPKKPFGDRKSKAAPFEGSSDAIHTEITRLDLLQAALEQFDASEAADIPRDETVDPQGTLLAAMLTWRQQRQAAIAAELARLRKLRGDKGQSCGTVASVLGMCSKE